MSFYECRNYTLICVSPVSECSDSIDVEAVLLLADGRVSFFHFRDVGFLVSLATIFTQTFLFEIGSLLFVQLVESPLWATYNENLNRNFTKKHEELPQRVLTT